MSEWAIPNIPKGFDRSREEKFDASNQQDPLNIQLISASDCRRKEPKNTSGYAIAAMNILTLMLEHDS